MTHLTEEETDILRECLGLSYWNRENPTRNRLDWTAKNDIPVGKLLRRRYLKIAASCSMESCATEWFYKATDAGRIAVMDQPWRE